eukprot:TRINITY_DN4710_c0_g1_i1.p1 TRINITY_DN4710_c0_g1~~TRINITY_DN4710_c0_g1_i1.p1  ORF type:complete len:362 (-),score=47.61 TRINITY_DN4710_c0_g1_i1:564-1649(-)
MDFTRPAISQPLAWQAVAQNQHPSDHLTPTQTADLHLKLKAQALQQKLQQIQQLQFLAGPLLSELGIPMPPAFAATASPSDNNHFTNYNNNKINMNYLSSNGGGSGPSGFGAVGGGLSRAPQAAYLARPNNLSSSHSHPSSQRSATATKKAKDPAALRDLAAAISIAKQRLGAAQPTPLDEASLLSGIPDDEKRMMKFNVEPEQEQEGGVDESPRLSASASASVLEPSGDTDGHGYTVLDLFSLSFPLVRSGEATPGSGSTPPTTPPPSTPPTSSPHSSHGSNNSLLTNRAYPSPRAGVICPPSSYHQRGRNGSGSGASPSAPGSSRSTPSSCAGSELHLSLHSCWSSDTFETTEDRWHHE